MKSFKKVLAVLLLTASLTGLMACGQSADDSSQSGQEANNRNAEMQDNNRRMSWGNNSPDIYGEVKSISGNKLTLALIEIPQIKQPTEEEMQKMKERRQNADNGDSTGFGNRPDDQGGKREGFNGPPPDMSGNGNGNKGNGNEGGNGDRRRDMGGMTQKKFTGQNQDIEIPSSASITTFERGNNEINEKKLAVGDIKVGMTVQIWYKKDNGDKKEIETVRVMQAPSSRPVGTPGIASSSVPSQKS